MGCNRVLEKFKIFNVRLMGLMLEVIQYFLES